MGSTGGLPGMYWEGLGPHALDPHGWSLQLQLQPHGWSFQLQHHGWSLRFEPLAV